MMGLSDIPSIKSAYGHRRYVRPSYGAWEEWFAWYPVKILFWQEIDSVFGGYMKLHRWVWLEKIARRTVTDHCYGPGREGIDTIKHREYATLMDLLKYGH